MVERTEELSWVGRGAVVALLSVAAVATLAHAAHTGLHVGSPSLDGFVNDWLYNAVYGLATAACLARAALVRSERWAWAAIAVGLGSWTIGNVYWTVELSDLRRIPYPSIADAFFLAGYPALYTGVILLLRERIAQRRLSLWLDGFAGALAGAGLGTALLAPAFIGLTRGNAATVVTNLAYPLADVALLAIVVGAVALTGLEGGRRWLMLAVGLVAIGVADGGYLYLEAQGAYEEGTILDAAWLVPAVLIAASAWTKSGGRHLELHGPASLAFPSVSVASGVVAGGLLLWNEFGSQTTIVATLAGATLAVVLARLVVAFGENAKLIASLERETVTDSLTGLGNRRRLFDELGALCESRRPMVLAIYDLDGFKAYNDSFGHHAGDLLLRRLSARLQAAVQTSGRAYRLGGDEFCVVLTRGLDNARKTLAAVGEALSERGRGFEVGNSGGSARLPMEAADPTAALRLADRRMYAEKGRRRSSAEQQTLAVLLGAVREREPDLEEHVDGVARYAVEVGRRLGMDAEGLDVLGRAAQLHDIGKIAIPDEILHKPGALSPDDWLLMRQHTVIGERILRNAPALGPVATLVRSSHERWDGAGYPDGMAGEEIPLGSRIIFVCDAFEAMVEDRVYRQGMGVEKALAELRANAGTQFDPQVVEPFIAVVRREQAGSRRAARQSVPA